MIILPASPVGWSNPSASGQRNLPKENRVKSVNPQRGQGPQGIPR
nr:MAG TPA: hypothetical protein [Caudoviricetes sp.]